MKPITERSLILTVAKRYKLENRNSANKQLQQVIAKLEALNAKKATVADVEAIIGSKNSWIKPPSCTECGNNTGGVVQFGEEVDWNSATVYLCCRCLRAALRQFKKRKKQ